MAQPSYFILDHPISANEIKSFLCRVVVSKTSPLTRFAPFSLPGKPSHNTNDIIPTILPEPNLSTSNTAFRLATRERGGSAKLSYLIGVDAARNKEQSTTLESEIVKRYVLENHEPYFEELMKNEEYAQDVRALLEKVWPRHAYLVTGFLTTTKTCWKRDRKHNNKLELNLTLPISAALPIAVPEVVDISGGFSGSSSSQGSDGRVVAEEEIFAVSYSVARLEYKPALSRTLFTSSPTIGRPKLAKHYHLAMGHDEEDEEEDEEEEAGELDWDSDDEIDHFRAASGQNNQKTDMHVIICGIETDELL